MEGWIKLYRKLLDNPIIFKDSETLAIWIYILLNATHTEMSAIFKGQKIKLQSGQLITGILSIAKKTKVDKNKVQRTLKSFENDNQIEQQTSNQNRLITIVNWNEYQTNDKQNEKQVINKRETTDKQLITNKNVKNERIYLFNLYKGKIEGKNFGTKLHIINECKNTKEYLNLSIEEQDKLFTELMQIE